MNRLRTVVQQKLFFPLLLFAIVAILTTFKVSGSSLAVYEVSAGASPSESGVVVGSVRPIRSDEWLVRTPWLLSQIQNGLPSETPNGLGQHDVGVVGDIPARNLDIIVKPHQISSWFLGPERALAAEWWIWHALMAIGIYSLLYTITLRPGLAVPISLIALFNPSTQWWAAPGTYTTVGYGCLAAASFITSMRCKNRSSRRWFAILAGWSVACFVCTLYVPWMITTTISVGFLTLGMIIQHLINSRDRRNHLIQMMETVAILSLVSVVLIGVFLLRHKTAIAAVNSTVYPGNRLGESGGTLNLATMFGAPFDYLASKPQTVNLNGTNQSENSSGVMFFVPVLVACLGNLKSRVLTPQLRSVGGLIAVLISGIVFLVWALFPISSTFGRFLLLDRVPPERLPPALALVSLLALGIFLNYQFNLGLKTSKKISIISILSFLAIHIYSASLYKVEQDEISLTTNMFVLILISVAIILLFQNFMRTGFMFLIALGALNFLQINPIQIGADPLLTNPVAQLVQRVESNMGRDKGWMLIGGDIYVRGSIEATGVSFLSGVSRYPNWDAWLILDPTLQYEESWNRYGHLSISVGEKNSEPVISSPQSDVIQIVIDPCDKRLELLNVDLVVVQDMEISGCGTLLDDVTWGNRKIRVYAL